MGIGHRSAAGARDLMGQAEVALARGDWRSKLARSGLVAKGILYAALGVLALQVARGEAASGRASHEGAIALVASQPLGQWLLMLFTVGLFALAAWQVILAFTGDPVDGSEPSDRAVYAGKAVLYAGTAITAMTTLMGRSGRGRGGASEDEAASMIMGLPGGRGLLALLGCAVLAAAIYQFYRHAWRKKFMNRLALGRTSGDFRRTLERAGRAGYAARGIVLAIAGVFFVIAAVRHNPREAVGLSGVLQLLTEQRWGDMVLWFVALGLLLYGCFCFAEAKYRRAT